MKNPRLESDISHASDCVFYDSELKQLRASFKSAYDTLKRIEKRAERRQTIQISQSLFDYVERERTKITVPQQFYDFKYADYRICIYHYHSKYSVLCVGFEFFAERWRQCDFYGNGRLYGEFDSFKDCLNLYCYAIDFFINRVLHYKDLDLYDNDIPF